MVLFTTISNWVKEPFAEEEGQSSVRTRGGWLAFAALLDVGLMCVAVYYAFACNNHNKNPLLLFANLLLAMFFHAPYILYMVLIGCNFKGRP